MPRCVEGLFEGAHVLVLLEVHAVVGEIDGESVQVEFHYCLWMFCFCEDSRGDLVFSFNDTSVKVRSTPTRRFVTYTPTK